jgi:hypothetical protein
MHNTTKLDELSNKLDESYEKKLDIFLLIAVVAGALLALI